MFDRIAHRYDFLNHFLSLGIDRAWRKKAIKLLAEKQPATIIDIATGTGDFAMAAMKLNPEKIIGIDLSERMLDIARRKVRKKGWEGRIDFTRGDSEHLAFENDRFEAAIVAFGVRNFEALDRGLSEILRILEPGGRLVVLEFSRPHNVIVRNFYYFYFFRILPWIGRRVSRDISAYTYLPESVDAFPSGREFLNIMNEVGFEDLQSIPLTFGIATIYRGTKKNHNNN
jgi:demethylmenaquinone methyltransferase/2-methoxy-6-polyprenyl-1,4-benzoquinol methylase